MGWAFEQHVMGYEALETQLVGFMEDEVGE
jgi:hypothetical protein